ncbi:MAG: hydrogenase maturation peptidase HycI [Candidatus Omnitrophica bacterium]|nr:hydrogenase maturation peptidase HycI [Candidatus Omnitrophota bacterium]
MLSLKRKLKKSLKGAKKVAILGIGSELRSDDAAGVVISRKLQAYIKKMKIKALKVFLGQTAPENLTGEIKKFNPTHLVIIDAIDFQKKAGTISIADARREKGASFSTHRMPIKFITDYLYKSIACDTIIIGIQPESLEFCGGLSPKIQESVRVASKEISEVLGKFA